MADDLEVERTLPASPRRRQQAREAGHVARSGELVWAVVMLGAVASLWGLGPQALDSWQRIGARLMDPAELARTAPAGLGATLRQIAWDAAAGVLPILLLAMLLAVIANIAQFGLLLAPKRLRLRLDAIDPVQNAARILGGRSWGRVLAAILRSAALVAVGFLASRSELARLVSLPRLDVTDALVSAAAAVLAIALKLALVLVGFGLIDFVWRRWRYEQDLLLTPEQAREEALRTGIHPQLKARRQQLARQRAAARARPARDAT